MNGAFPAAMEFSAGGCGGILAAGGNLKGAGELMGVILNGVVASDCEGVDGAEGEKVMGFCDIAGSAPNDGGVDSAFAGGVGSWPKGILGDAGRAFGNNGALAGAEEELDSALVTGAPDNGELLTGREVGRPIPKDAMLLDAVTGFGDIIGGFFSSLSGEPGGVVLAGGVLTGSCTRDDFDGSPNTEGTAVVFA